MNERARPEGSDDGATSEAPRPFSTPELELLRLLEQHPDYSQRQMSTALGVSLGKAHYLLRSLLAKGWVKAANFKRSKTKSRYLYVLTPSGMHQRLQLTYAFLARKEREYDLLHAQIAALKAELAMHDGAEHPAGRVEHINLNRAVDAAPERSRP